MVNNLKIIVINCYGPQEDDKIEHVLSFWQKVEEEIVNAKNTGCLLIVQLDANAKVGNTVISQERHHMSNNGVNMMDMVRRQNL